MKRTGFLVKWILGVMLFSLVMAVGYSEKLMEAEAATSDFEQSISDFPDSYKPYLRALHNDYPEWEFEAFDTGLNFKDVVAAESQNDKSLIQNVYSDLLKSRAESDYNASTGKYIYKDGSSWVTADEATVAYFVDPRNFLNEKQIYQFELLSYDSSVHTQKGTDAILKNSFMYNTVMVYLNSSGTVKTYDSTYTYAYMINLAGKTYGVSPYYLAAKILQEIGSTGSSTVAGMGASGSVSGTYSGYKGIYNFYNIGASDGTNAVANGLKWASTGSTYLRPWNTPDKSIKGGAKYIAEKYINAGQNTSYLQRFNVNSSSNYPLYTHQYMTSIYATAAEATSTYSAYSSLGITDESKVFYIPVYNNMPSETATVKLQGTGNKSGVTISSVNMRSGPGTSYTKVVTIPSDTIVTVIKGVQSDIIYSSSWLNNPYWYYINATVNGTEYTGYVCAEYVDLNKEVAIFKGKTKTLKTTISSTSEAVYYESDNPAIATVDSNGKVTAVSVGKTTIRAYTAAGSFSACAVVVKPEQTKIASAGPYGYNRIKLTWNAISGVDGYAIYRSTAQNGTYKRIATVSGSSTTKYIDKDRTTGTTYYYRIRAYQKYNGVTLYGKYSTKVSAASRPYRGRITSITNNSKGKVTLTWKRVNGATAYVVYRKKKGASSYKRIAVIKGNSTFTYADTNNLVAGTTYYYKIRAYRTVGSKNIYGRLSKAKKITITK
ncbi:MAG: Ig-like domain-containing protein [Eubacterium sp.]